MWTSILRDFIKSLELLGNVNFDIFLIFVTVFFSYYLILCFFELYIQIDVAL